MSDPPELTELTISDSIEMYLQERSGEVSDSTLEAHKYRLRQFRRWAAEEGPDVTSELGPADLYQYRLSLQDRGLKPVTVRTKLQTFRVYLRFCEAIEAVEPDLSDKLRIPNVEPEEERSEAFLDGERAADILEALATYQHGSFDHALLALLWRTGLRIGAVAALDVGDVDLEAQRLHVAHRPDTSTPLKNGRRGERIVALREDTCTVLEAYLDVRRRPYTDDDGRRPLFVSQRDCRMTISGLRERVYRLTQPCEWSGECPHGREPGTCEAREHGRGSRCPSSRSPHALRRGAITHHLSADVPERVVADRMDVSPEVIDKHYDARKPEEKTEQRRSVLEDRFSG